MDEVMEEELKDNACRVSFRCCEEIGKHPKDCVYFIPQKDKYYVCKYDNDNCGVCGSAVAQANAMVRALKARGVKI